MPKAEFDQIVKASAALVTEADVNAASIVVAARSDGREWTKHEPLNVLAYEDQRRPSRRIRRIVCAGEGS